MPHSNALEQERLTLKEALGAAAEGLVPRAPFEARIRGQVVSVLAVLDRTSVYQVESGERYTARHELVVPVEPIVWVSERNPDRESGRRGRARSAAANRGRRRSGGAFYAKEAAR